MKVNLSPRVMSALARSRCIVASPPSGFGTLRLHRLTRIIGVEEDRDTWDLDQDLLQEIEPLSGEFRRDACNAGDVAARARQAGHEAGGDSIAPDHDDWDSGRGLLSRLDYLIADGDDHV